MPARMDPNDWDRLFAPNAPRRGGPLRALGISLLLLVVVGALGTGITFAMQVQRDRQTAFQATSTAVMITNTAIAAANAPTLTAIALNGDATATAEVPAATPSPSPTEAPALGTGTVQTGGNLRNDTRIAPETVIGLIWAGDQIAFLERRDVNNQVWYRIRITQAAPNRGGVGVPVGTEGWASATLLSQPAQP